MGLARDPQALDSVIGQMDAINHAIPMREELEEGLGRLTAAGLMSVSGGEFRLTQAGLDLVREASGSRRSWHAAWDQVESALESTEYPAALPSGWEIAEETYDEAVRTYLGRMKSSGKRRDRTTRLRTRR